MDELTVPGYDSGADKSADGKVGYLAGRDFLRCGLHEIIDIIMVDIVHPNDRPIGHAEEQQYEKE